MRDIRDEKETFLKKLQKLENENEDKIAQFNIFNSDLEALAVQINCFKGMCEEMNIELENLQEEHDFMVKQ